MHSKLKAAIFAFAAFGAGVASATAAARPERTTIMTAEASLRDNQLAWGRKWAERDAEGILSHYAPEAVLFVPGEPAAQGRDVFGPFIHEILGNPNFSLAWAVDRAVTSGDGSIGYVYGRYVQHNPQTVGYEIETGHYVTTFRRERGKWLAIAEINTPGKIATHDGLPEAAFRPFPADGATHAGPDIEAANVALIRRHIIEFWQQGRVELGTQLYAPGFIDHNPAPGTPPGLPGIIGFVQLMQNGFSDQKYEIVHLFASNDLVVDHWVLRARHTGEFLGIKPTGRKIEFAGSDIFRIKDGKIVDIWHTEEIARLMDELTVAR